MYSSFFAKVVQNSKIANLRKSKKAPRVSEGLFILRSVNNVFN
ncbi:hypothetical protein HMPREF9078_00290 [Capnocytophaga sp. oral taxon 380 str. F0488]|nr:hypothetical protein HMPREF9078_00290 [Capnocytophaga sp. oral taxon 380 str. F0488]